MRDIDAAPRELAVERGIILGQRLGALGIVALDLVDRQRGVCHLSISLFYSFLSGEDLSAAPSAEVR